MKIRRVTIFVFCLVMLIACSQQKKNDIKVSIVDLEGNEQVLLTQNDIVSYEWEKHKITITKSLYNALADINIYEGYKFKIYFKGAAFVTGNFISAVLSNFDTTLPIVYFDMENKLFVDKNTLGFEIKCYNCEQDANPLENKQFYNYLKENHLLK